MKLLVAKLIFLSIFVNFVASFDDAKCDEQLRKFESSLENRDRWAVRCKVS